MAVPPISDAVTAVLRHGGHILLVRRNPALAAFPGYWAFPGGKVDAEDAEAPSRDAPWCHGIDVVQIEALVRELREEVALDLDQQSPEFFRSPAKLIGTALTPSHVPRRFDTHFFLLDLATRPSVTLDVGEVIESRWVRPADFLDEYHAGAVLVAPPTLATIKLLDREGGAPEKPAELEPAIEPRIPMSESIHGLRLFPVRSHTLPPANHTNCFVIGDDGAPCLMIDPSPWSDEEMEALLERVAEFPVSEVFLTHHHPDHRERANLIARRLGVSMSCSADTHRRIEQAEPDYFSEIDHRVIEDGQVLTQWLGSPVRALAVPGHDEGQLALMPDNAAWCIVGDLIQGIGTVVIHKPEGHMGRYFASLERVIGLDPAAIVPSHGIPMGTVHRLEETLKHRKMRESEVLKLHREDCSPEQMLGSIYGDIDPVLKPLALQNIQAHLEKLQEDGRLSVA